MSLSMEQEGYNVCHLVKNYW